MISLFRLKIWLVLVVVLGFGGVLTACVTTTAQPVVQETNAQPLVLITQVVTQIVATPTTTPVPPPTSAAAHSTSPAPSGGYDPFSAPIYYPIQGCFASRLHIGDVAFVANGAGIIGIHQTRDVGYAPIWRHLEAGEMLDILKGPWCDRGALVWKVATHDGHTGFVTEGDGNTYWLLPMPPNTEPVLSKEELKLRMFLPPGESLTVINSNRSYCR